MKNAFLLSLVLIASLAIPPGPARSENTVNLATLDWEPYIGAKMKDQGYVAILVKEAYRAAGYTVKFSFMPWARVVAMARAVRYDGYLPEYFAESLQADYLVSDPFPGGPLGFFKRKADPIVFKSLEDLKPYKIGVVRDYVNTGEFDRAGYLMKEEANNDVINLRKLVGKRVDLVVMDKVVGLYLMHQDMPDRLQEVEFMEPPLEEKKLYLCISRKTPDAEAKMRAFNNGLKIIKNNGKLTAILKANGF